MSVLLKQQHIHTRPLPSWLVVAGLGKGLRHDRQPLGFILAAGEKIRCRQINPDYKTALDLRLLNNNSATESRLIVDSQWKELTALGASAVFIDTPYQEGTPTVEFEYPQDSKILPVFRKGDSEDLFFQAWEENNAELALIDMPYALILVPHADMAHLKTLGPTGGIDGLVDYYESIFTYFNALAGISFEPASDTDRNIPNRYFLKADKNGAGSAYYGTYWAAQSSTSTRRFWLTPSVSNWGCLHEIGHGYQGKFSSDKFFYTGEIWNNIYVCYWQRALLGERKYKQDAFYNGNQQAFEDAIAKHISNGNPVANWGLGQRLFFFISMIEAAGESAFTQFNQQYRKNINSAEFVPDDHPILDMLSHSFARTAAQVDVTPYMQLLQAPITAEQCDRNLFSKAKAVYPLNQFFEGEQLLEQQAALELGSHFDLITTQKLLPSGLTGSVTLELEIDEFEQIREEEFCVMDGARYVRQLPIVTPQLRIPELPVGIYALRLPTGKNRKYKPQLSYLIVKPGENSGVVNFLPVNTSGFPTQKIWILGRGDWNFGWLLVDHYERTVKLSITKETPHSSFPDFYARFIIKNTQGSEVFNLAVPGVGATVKDYEIPFEAGYEITVEHKQSGGFKTFAVGIINPQTKDQTWQITKLGLKNPTLPTDTKAIFLALLANKARAIRDDAILLNAPCFAKVEFYLALQLFDLPEREELMQQYADCIPANN